MESLVATSDWLKDYDPLFDLFDEEMRSGEADDVGLASGPSQMCAAFAGDYMYFTSNDCDLNHYCFNNSNSNSSCSSSSNSSSKQLQYQSDELSILLGLEWMPHVDLGSPNLAGRIVHNNNKSRNLINDDDNSVRKNGFDVAAINNAASGSVGSTLSPKKKKRCIRTKGTSLLASPASAVKLSPQKTSVNSSGSSLSCMVTPKAAMTPAPATSTTSTMNKTPLSTLLTINDINNKVPSSYSHQSNSSSQQVLTKKPAVTNLLSQKQQQQQQQQQHHLLQHSLKFITTPSHLQQEQQKNLTKTDVVRYCFKIEHSYALP